MDLAISGEIFKSKPGQGNWIDIERTVNITEFLFYGFSISSFFVHSFYLFCSFPLPFLPFLWIFLQLLSSLSENQRTQSRSLSSVVDNRQSDAHEIQELK